MFHFSKGQKEISQLSDSEVVALIISSGKDEYMKELYKRYTN